MPSFTGTPPLLSSSDPVAILNWARQLERWLRGQVLGNVVPSGSEGQVVGYGAGGALEAVTLSTGGFQLAKHTKTYADFAIAGATQSVNLDGPPAGRYWAVPFFFWKHSEAFTGGTIVSCDADLGRTGDLQALNGAGGELDVFAAPAADGFFFGTAPFPEYPVAVLPTDYVVLSLTCNGGSTLDELTAGSIDVWIWYQELTPTS